METIWIPLRILNVDTDSLINCLCFIIKLPTTVRTLSKNHISSFALSQECDDSKSETPYVFATTQHSNFHNKISQQSITGDMFLVPRELKHTTATTTYRHTDIQTKKRIKRIKLSLVSNQKRYVKEKEKVKEIMHKRERRTQICTHHGLIVFNHIHTIFLTFQQQ
jgi:hypothetical protein